MSTPDQDAHPEQLEPFPVERTERVYDSKWCGLRRDFLRLADGSLQEHHVFEVPEAVCVVPVLPDGSIVLLWQFRHPLGRAHWEIPAGRMHAGERPEEAAERELLEETGYRAAELERVVGFHPLNGISPHLAHAFIARGCERVAEQDLEPAERASVHVVPEARVRELLLGGELKDAFALVGLFHHFHRVDR